MTIETTPFDIGNNPELLRLDEEVEATHTPRLLKRDNTPIAVISPVKKKQTSQAKSNNSGNTCYGRSMGGPDWDEVEAELDRIRHSSKPTPPFSLCIAT